MDLRKPKGGSSKLKEMQDQLKEKNLKTLGKIADNINFENVPADPTNAMIWVAETIEKFTVEVPVLSERGSPNDVSRSQTPFTKGKQRSEETNDIDLSNMVIDNGEERLEDVVRNAITGQRRRKLDARALQLFGKSPTLPSKKKWMRRQHEELEKELDRKFARASFQAVDSFEKLSDLLFASRPAGVEVSKEITQRNALGISLIKNLCGKSRPSNSESAADLQLSLNRHSIDRAPLLEAFKVLAGSKSIMGQILSVYRNIADQDLPNNDSLSSSSRMDQSTPLDTDKTSCLTNHGATTGSPDSPDAQADEDKKRETALQQRYYIDATKILIEMSDRDFSISQVIPYAGSPVFLPPVPYNTGEIPNHVYAGPPMYAQTAPHPPPGPQNYSSPYAETPIHLQGVPYATSSEVYASPYTESGPIFNNVLAENAPQTSGDIALVPAAKILRTQSENVPINSQGPVVKGTKRKRQSSTGKGKGRKGKAIINNKAPIIDLTSIRSSSSEQEIEAQKDIFEKTGKLYPQTLSQIDALLTMANGGIFPGTSSPPVEMEVDEDATESDSEPVNNASPRSPVPAEAGEDAQIMLIVDRIMDDVLALRDWQERVLQGTFRQAMLADERGLFLASELKRLVILARPLVNVILPAETGKTISVFYTHLSTRTNPTRVPLPPPIVAPMGPPPPPVRYVIEQPQLEQANANTTGGSPLPGRRQGQRRKGRK